MAITPNDILSKTFERSFRGYDEDQVDEFLDALKEEIERINEENHLLMGQIMSLEEEIQTHKLTSNEESDGESPSAEDSEMLKAGIASAKATASRIIADANETAENIVKSANKKAVEMMSRIDAERKKVTSAPLLAAASASTASNDQVMAATRQKASEIMEQAKMKADALIAQTKTQAEEQAKRIVQNAEQKAASTASDMDSEMAEARQKLETIQNAVKAYKSKLESFINNQAHVFKGYNPDVPGFNPNELNLKTVPDNPVEPTAPDESPSEKPMDKPAEAVKTSVQSEPEIPVYKPENQASEKLDGPPTESVASSAQSEPEIPIYKPVETEVAKSVESPSVPEPKDPGVPIYKPYQTSDNDVGYADDLKFSGYNLNPRTDKADSAQRDQTEKSEPIPTVSSIISDIPSHSDRPEKAETSASKPNDATTDDADERYRQVLNQIRNIEKTKDELKANTESVKIDSVNPVKDMTDKVQPVSQADDTTRNESSVIISDDDEFVGKISAADPIEWDEPVTMSDEEKRHLREMLDDML